MGQLTFAERIRERYPEGLTGVFAVGGTRTAYVLQQRRNTPDPGLIDDFVAYVNYAFDRLFLMFDDFYQLGGQNLIIPLFSYQGFYERGEEYGHLAAEMCLQMIEPSRVQFYIDNDIDPYFAGIDTLIALPEDRFEHRIGLRFEEFQQKWQYREGRRKLISEVAPIPLYSYWNAHRVMEVEEKAKFESELSAVTELREMHDLLYRYYSRAVYGTEIPYPHFYLGTNRNGDMKLRALLPISLLCGGPFRMFFTPYPTLFMTRETLQTILEDLAFGKPFTSRDKDYSGKMTPELVEMEYQRIMKLAADPRSTLGLIRQAQPVQED